MMPPYAFENLLSLSLQIAVLVSAGLLLPLLLRVRPPLAWCQALLGLALLLPLVQPWRSETVEVSAAPPAASGARRVAAGPDPVTRPAQPRAEVVAATVLAGGAALRLLWLALGIVRLRRYRSRSAPLPDLRAMEEARRLTGASAEFRSAGGLAGPVTFGFRRPVVLTPPDFVKLDEPAQLAIACHELLHVRRHDWLASLAEEMAATLLWFHPAVWWLLAHTRLAREEAVDRAVIGLTEARDPYVSALLAFAAAPGDLAGVPAPPFLGKSHLLQRIRTLMKEVRMSNRRRFASLGASAAVLAAAGWLTVATFPLRAGPRYRIVPAPVALQAQTPAGAQTPGAIVRAGEIRAIAIPAPGPVTRDAAGRAVLRPFEYPPAAREKKIEGEVLIELQFNPAGEVIDARVLSGPDELRAAALRRALQPLTLPEKTARLEVVVPFKIEDTPPGMHSLFDSSAIIRRVDLSRLSADEQARVRPLVSPYEGRVLNRKLMDELMSALRPALEAVSVSFERVGPANEVIVAVRNSAPPPPQFGQAQAPDRIRVGGNVQAAKLIRRVEPDYPPLARQARIQGTVRFAVVIGKEGDVKNITVQSGHPLLVPAALEAVKQWVFEPTLLNGAPVEVVSTVDVDFALPAGV